MGVMKVILGVCWCVVVCLMLLIRFMCIVLCVWIVLNCVSVVLFLLIVGCSLVLV